MKKIFSIISCLALSFAVFAQKTDYPVFGAQIFIEPGQSAEEVENCFAVMEECGMQVGRIRMFGTHLYHDGKWDFSLYDRAFDAAQRHNVKLFATLFPFTDELTDVGGFKFPSSKKHLAEIDEYTRAVVGHFKSHPALYAWVLQNEPGLEDATGVEMNDLSEPLFKQWAAENLSPKSANEYLKADFAGEDFLRYYTAWYLDHIAGTVIAIDPIHGRHINPHQLMKNLPQYDFRAYSGFLTSLGASLHLSWHFGLFQRDEFALGVSLMEDIIRGNAHPHPFWVTELQGGTVIWSGRVPYCPTKEHIAQYLWTSVGAGAEGVIFWTLNQRKAVQEGGEWGMLNFEGRPSDRLEETAKVAAAVKENAPLFEGLKPYEPDVTILYNVKSLQMQKRDSDLWPSPETGRKETSVMCSLIASYQALASWGINAQVRDMDNFDWSNSEGLIAIIPDMICIPSDKTEAIREFVKNGGKLIVTGRSGYFDENMRCAFMGGHPLEDVLGGKLLEFKYTDDYFKIGGLDSHLWRGIIRRSAFSSEPVASYNGETSAIWHPYGKGEVVWFPSMIELGAYHRDIIPLAKFIGKECRKVIDKAPFHLCKPVKGVLARTMTDDNGNMLIVLVNKTGKKVRLRPSLRLGKSSTNIIYGGDVASVRRCRIVLKKEATVVISTAASK